MKEYNIVKRLEKLDKSSSKIQKIFYYIFIPYYFFLENYCRYNIWKKFILRTMLTTDDIVQTLDEQDFALENDMFIKKELLNDPEKSESENIYNFKDLKKAKQLIHEDFTKFFVELLRKNFQFDVENYVNLTVAIDVDTTKDHGEIYHETVYTVILRWWREVDYIHTRNMTLVWLLIVAIITTLTIFII